MRIPELILCALLATAPLSFANPQYRTNSKPPLQFPDVPADHWARPHLFQFASSGIIKGDSTGRFNGNAPVTRHEFSLVLHRLNSRRPSPFPTPQWATEQKPLLTRYEFAVAMTRLEHFFDRQATAPATAQNEGRPTTAPAHPTTPAEQTQEFPDISPTHWAFSAANSVASRGIMEGDYLGRFHGDKLLTRYQLVATLWRSLPSHGLTAEPSAPLQNATPTENEPK